MRLKKRMYHLGSFAFVSFLLFLPPFPSNPPYNTATNNSRNMAIPVEKIAIIDLKTVLNAMKTVVEEL